MSGFISLKDVSKVYATTTKKTLSALSDVSFEVDAGEFVTIVGPSGCGKSTLLKVIAGLISYTGGTVTVGGKEVKGPVERIGIVFQVPALLRWRRVMDNILLPVEIRRLDTKQYRKRAADLIELTGLSGFEDSYPSQLSGGMQQRAAICRALILDPDLLLMDEPFGALDAYTREKMNLEILRIWSNSKKTVLFVTHSIPESVLLADRVIVMSPRPGRVVAMHPIALPRPRVIKMLSTPEFGAYTSEIRAEIEPPGSSAPKEGELGSHVHL